jgi:signal transduction histidine kinase
VPIRTPRLAAAAVIGPLVVAGIAVGAVFWANRIADDREAWVRHTDQVAYAIAGLDGAVTDAAMACRGWILLGDSVGRAQFDTAEAAATKDLADLHALTRDNPVQVRRLDTADLVIRRELALLRHAADLATTGRRGPAADLLRAGGAQDSALIAVHALTDRLTSEEDRLHAIRVAAERRQRLFSAILLLVGVGLAIALSVVLSNLLSRAMAFEASLLEQLRAANQTLTDQAMELEMANQSLQEQAAELEQSNEELASTTEELAERSHAAETANNAKTEFLTRMSHELRTPLNAITGYASLLQQGVRGPVTDTQHEDITRIQRAAQHLLGLINDVLNFARIEVGRVQYSIGEVPASAVITEAASMIEPLAASRGLSFDTGAADGLMLKADRERTVQIVINLLSNAVKFTPQGGRVEITARRGERGVDVVVSDTGRGIPADALENIFDPFVQIGRANPGGGEGLGLGLAISRELARAMGGNLRVTSEVGRGSVFTLELPSA